MLRKKIKMHSIISTVLKCTCLGWGKTLERSVSICNNCNYAGLELLRYFYFGISKFSIMGIHMTFPNPN